MKLNQIANNQGATKAPKRVGRGIGSGTGKTAGRGHKGQKSRSGVSIRAFEGGQQPIYRRLPKRGFFNKFRTVYQSINVGLLQEFISAGKLDAKKTITKESLLEAGIVKKAKLPIKLLGEGQISAKVTIEVDASSKSAAELVEKAGGKVVLPAAA